MGRVPEVDIPDASAMSVLEGNLMSVRDPEEMAKYEPLSFRRRGCWARLYPNRGLLVDLFKASAGCLLRQVAFARQCHNFLENLKIHHVIKDAERLAYRIRCQMSHIREHALNHRFPPVQFGALRAVIDFIPLELPASVGVGETVAARPPPMIPLVDHQPMQPFTEPADQEVSIVEKADLPDPDPIDVPSSGEDPPHWSDY